MSYFVSRAEAVHRADLVRAEGFAEQIDRRHLAPEDPLLVNVGSRTHVAFVERLEDIKKLLKYQQSVWEKCCFSEWIQYNFLIHFYN